VFSERQLVELLHYFLPEEGALRRQFDGAFGNAAKVGDVALRRLAGRADALDQDSRPVGIRPRSPAERPDPALALLPPDERRCLVMYKKDCARSFLYITPRC
jgi:hypothetical protein